MTLCGGKGGVISAIVLEKDQCVYGGDLYM